MEEAFFISDVIVSDQLASLDVLLRLLSQGNALLLGQKWKEDTFTCDTVCANDNCIVSLPVIQVYRSMAWRPWRSWVDESQSFATINSLIEKKAGKINFYFKWLTGLWRTQKLHLSRSVNYETAIYCIIFHWLTLFIFLVQCLVFLSLRLPLRAIICVCLVLRYM